MNVTVGKIWHVTAVRGGLGTPGGLGRAPQGCGKGPAFFHSLSQMLPILTPLAPGFVAPFYQLPWFQVSGSSNLFLRERWEEGSRGLAGSEMQAVRSVCPPPAARPHRTVQWGAVAPSLWKGFPQSSNQDHSQIFQCLPDFGHLEGRATNTTAAQTARTTNTTPTAQGRTQRNSRMSSPAKTLKFKNNKQTNFKQSRSIHSHFPCIVTVPIQCSNLVTGQEQREPYKPNTFVKNKDFWEIT